MISANTNIKNLPEVDQITEEDFLVVENFNGTNKLQFKDFVIGPDNTSFFNGLATNIISLSSKNSELEQNIDTSVSLISSNVAVNNDDINNLKTSLNAVSSTFVSEGDYKWVKLDIPFNLNLFAPVPNIEDYAFSYSMVPNTQNKIFNIVFSLENKFSLRVNSFSIVPKTRPLYFGWNYTKVGVILDPDPTRTILGYTYTFSITANESINSSDEFYIQIYKLEKYSSYFGTT